MQQLHGQAGMASARVGDRARATSMERLRDAATLQVLLLFLNNYFGDVACNPGEKNTPSIKSLLAKSCEKRTSLYVLFAGLGCCLAGRRVSIMQLLPRVVDHACKHMRTAHAGRRTRIASMGGLYDTATLHAPPLHSKKRLKNRSIGKKPFRV
jgi:hypothetical protein